MWKYLLTSIALDYSALPNHSDLSDQNTVITVVLRIVFSMAASVALLLIVIGGFRYILAKGDPNGIARSRDTIIYALVGLVVIMLAYAIVTFTIGNVF